jgi:hypothetical protein
MTENNSKQTDNQFLIPQNYEFNLNDYIQLGWNIFKQNIGGFVGFTFLNVFIFSIILLLLFVIVGKVDGAEDNDINTFGGIFFLILSFLLGNYALLWVLICGYLSVAHKIHRKEPYAFRDFYDFFRYKEELIPLFFTLFVINLVIGGIAATPIMLVFVLTSLPIALSDSILMLFFFMPYFVILYLNLIYAFSPLLVMFGNLGWKEAMRVSRKTIHKRFLKYLRFAFFLNFVALGGLGVFYFGTFVTFPIAVCIFYAAYAQIFGAESKVLEKMIAEIGEDKRD